MTELVAADERQRERERQVALALSKKAASVGTGTLTGTSNALITFAAGSTLLPQHIAELVTSISLIARMSLKSSAFFIEVILEAAKYGTGIGLGLTRRALISAIGTARAAHALRNGEDWDPQTAGLAIEDGTRSSGGALSRPRDAFLTVLDRWTSLGIYVIHHSFTMAELFAMSGFYLVDAGIKAGVNAADESVRLIDGIFGSNETSRALSSFITLVRRELSSDEQFAALGGMRGVAALTKALTTFAVLQNATYKRTAKTHKTRVLYDCTVLGEAETKSWRAMIVGPGNFARRAEPLGLPDVPARGSSQRITAGGAPSSDAASVVTGSSSRPWSGSMRRGRSFYADEPCLTDVQSYSGYEAGSSAAPSSDPLDDELALLEDLDKLMGDDDSETETEGQAGGDGTIRSSHTMAVRHDELPETMRQAIGRADDDELRRGLVIDQRQRNSRHPRDVRRVVRKREGGPAQPDEIYEIITETVELVEETTTTTTTTLADSQGPLLSERKASKPKRGLIPFASAPSSSSRGGTDGGQSPPVPTKTQRDSYNSHADSKSETFGRGRRETTTATEDEWLEVTRTTSSLGLDDLADRTSTLRGIDIPEAPNGKPASESIGTLSRQETLQQSPEEGKQRMQVVLKTMTRKLIKKRRIIRRVKDEGSGEEDLDPYEEELDDDRGAMALQQRFLPLPDAPASADPNATQRRKQGAASSSQSGSSFQRALQRARPAFLSPPGSKKTKAGAARDAGDHSDSTMRSAPSSATPSPPSTPPRPAKAVLPPPRLESRSLQIPAQAPAPPPKDKQSRFRTPNKRRGRNGSISSMHSFSSAVTQTHVATSSSAAREEEGPKGAPDAFPRQHLVKNLSTFMKHSSAAYGQAFMRILGLSEAQYVFGDTKKHHSNVYSYAHHCGLPLDNILLSSYAEDSKLPFHSEKMAPIVNYVSVDDEAKAVILTCRGTLGLSDMLTDLTCDYEDIDVEEAKPEGVYQVHSGMMAQAKRLAMEGSTVLQTLRRALQDRPDYGLVLTGHSLGGGVAALLAILWASPSHAFKSAMLKLPAAECPSHPIITTPFVTSLKASLGVPGRPIKVYAYGPPCVSSIDLGTWSRGLVVSVVHGYDIVPSLSLGLVRDFRSVATSLSDEREGDLAQEIVGRYVGLYQRKRKAGRGALGGGSGGAGLLSNDLDDEDAMAAISRPPDIPAHERQMTFDMAEIEAGRSRNRANDASYQDPHLSSGPKEAGADKVESASFTEPDEELANWMWSLIRTMRADMQNTKLYPPGNVYCVESFDIYVTPRTTTSSSSTFHRSGAETNGTSQGEGSTAAQAHRVILRECGDVEARFSEPIFAKTMLRDHVPTNYSHCLELLHEAVIR